LRKGVFLMDQTLETLNQLDQAAFVAALGGLAEHSPWVVANAWHRRPFADRDGLFAALCTVIEQAPYEQQLALIRAHPDLAGKAAIAGELTAESSREQASAGLDRLSTEEYTRFHQLNTAYRERFAMPFIICVRENTKASILANFAARLDNDTASEVATALREIMKIIRLRVGEV
jgi:2-oxo-4-hydroxy-4-carboxy-5-ureidoimidazoline decarboxylase